jgi:hypothetical protein
MKASITYNAQGESKVLEWGGYTFFDGKATDVYDPGMIESAKTNRFFKVGHIDENAEKPSAEEQPNPSHESRASSHQSKK